jgi:hypothetical protein
VFAIVACTVAAIASLLRGGKYHWAEEEPRRTFAIEEAA